MSYDMRTEKSFGDTTRDLRECFRKWGKEVWGSWSSQTIDWDIEANTSRMTARGLPEIDRLVTLWYVHPETSERKELRLSKFDRVIDNARALYLAVEAIRLNEARGLGEVFRQNYAQLPAPRARDPYEILGVRSDAAPEIIDAAYRAAAKKYHPDVGGSPGLMAELNEAYEAVKR